MPVVKTVVAPKLARRVGGNASPGTPPKPPALFNVHEAKTQLSRLLARVEAGEEITIARAGQPFARLVPLVPRRPRVPGRFKGMFGPLTATEALAPLPPEYSGLVPGTSDPLEQP